MSDLILALDQGTSATKACIYEPPGLLRGVGTVHVAQTRSLPGEVEQDPQELVESCRLAAEIALRDAGVGARDLTAAALANQGESFLLLGPDGMPVGPVIGWQDTRCGDVLDRLSGTSAGDLVAERTGLPLHPEFVAPKLAYHLARGEAPPQARLATLDTWLMHELDPSRPLVTDRGTASRTMLVGVEDQDWSDDLLEAFGIPRHVLPEIVACDSPGTRLALDGVEIPLRASSFDQGLALLGHGCLAAGDAKATFGTCLDVMAATGSRPVRAGGLLTTLPYSLAGRAAYALDGEIAACGALISWVVALGIAGSAEELDRLAAQAPDTRGAVVVPALTGLGAPHWRGDVSAAVVGLNPAVGRPEFARAVLDSIAWSLRDVLEALVSVGMEVAELRVDGGVTRSPTLMQRCADISGMPVAVSPRVDSTAFGAAALAMLALGLVQPDEIHTVAPAQRYEPGLPPTDEDVASWRRSLADALVRATRT